MHRRAHLLTAAFLTLTLFGGTAIQPVPSAASTLGCCMVRDGARAPWVQVGTKFSDCERRNAREDDDIFEPRGRVWWNIDC